MQLARRAGAAVAAAGIGLAALSAAGPAAAAAAPKAVPRGCPPNYSYEISHVHHYFVTNKGTATQVTGPGGVRLYLAVSKGKQVKGAVSGSGSWTIGGVLAEAQLTITVNIRFSMTLSIKQHKAWTVPARWAHGWLAWGSRGYSFDWKRVRTDAACHVETIGHGTAKLPDKPQFGFAHGRGIAPPETG